MFLFVDVADDDVNRFQEHRIIIGGHFLQDKIVAGNGTACAASVGMLHADADAGEILCAECVNDMLDAIVSGRAHIVTDFVCAEREIQIIVSDDEIV